MKYDFDIETAHGDQTQIDLLNTIRTFAQSNKAEQSKLDKTHMTLIYIILTHLCRSKMADILISTYSHYANILLRVQ